ncbi:hypothetical protein [Nitrobacter sp. TKz-YC01]|uniref:hypothetical protein n=1 Tax=Nitrobacter sp. TKz-YC01 TaxID=3398703 RepID=UPI003A0FF621
MNMLDCRPAAPYPLTVTHHFPMIDEHPKKLLLNGGTIFGWDNGKGLHHGFSRHAISSGAPLNLIQRLLGHPSVETTYSRAIGDNK